MTKFSELPQTTTLNPDDLVPILRPTGGGGFTNQMTPVGAMRSAQAGADGQSAYELAVALGFQGTAAGWLMSLKGDRGLSAYEQLVASNEFNGTFEQWIATLKGASAYQLALDNGFVGDVGAWLASLKGAKGDQGVPGTPGADAPTDTYELKGLANGRSTLIGDYTLGLPDIGFILESNSTNTITLTIPAEAHVNFPINTVINLYRYGAGDFIVSCVSDVALFSVAGNRKLAQQHATAMLWKRGPDLWVLAGTLKA